MVVCCLFCRLGSLSKDHGKSDHKKDKEKDKEKEKDKDSEKENDKEVLLSEIPEVVEISVAKEGWFNALFSSVNQQIKTFFKVYFSLKQYF